MEALGNELELALAGAGEMTDSCYRAQEVCGGGGGSAEHFLFFSCRASLVKKTENETKIYQPEVSQ